MSVLKAARNEYGGIYVVAADLPGTADRFAQQLAASLDEWMQEGIKVAWLQIPAARSELIAVAVSQGFEFHHCHPAELNLVKRLVPDAYLPLFSTHTIGVGAVVLSEQRELLTVLERRDVIARPQFYKLPGGMLERGEHLEEGVQREVFEETGVRTAFEGLLSFRHHHKGQFGTSNIYAVCRLRPLSREIVIDEEEIGDAKWIDVDDYLAGEGIGLYLKRVVRAALSAEPLRSEKIDGHMKSPTDYEIYVPADTA